MKSATRPPVPKSQLFGDLALEEVFALTRGKPGPFAIAAGHFRRGDIPGTCRALESVAAMQGLRSRERIQAWRGLQELGCTPQAPLQNEVFGVIVEVGMEAGEDLLAAFADRTAHYYNYSGAGIIWERPDASLDSNVDALLAEGSKIVENTGVWRDTRRPSPTVGRMRLNVLTPLGIYFGEGTFEALEGDALARPIVLAAINLMQKLTSLRAGQRTN